jgi:hypothetical protein
LTNALLDACAEHGLLLAWTAEAQRTKHRWSVCERCRELQPLSWRPTGQPCRMTPHCEGLTLPIVPRRRRAAPDPDLAQQDLLGSVENDEGAGGDTRGAKAHRDCVTGSRIREEWSTGDRIADSDPQR